ncbi:Stk1 family PASTA domain-containing Ser/Thr kinase [Actinopolymorpha sp. B17G11]|uniref:Stk1 family PASTA domain-containing Ser/Thr kinase n=1 Tax=Actinopolymorpha sp. B17G11 TaxID=3160861 RepID=UPI0032E3D7A0
MDVSVSDPMVGRLLDGRYRVGRRIARGGMAMVYEAVDTRLHRTVALKMLHAGLADDADFVRRFHREARSAARLSHPHVVAMFDQGEDDGTPYLTMEYVPGRTLRHELSSRGRLDPREALTFLDLILQALATAHEADLIHRDVKPENVLLGDDGSVKVADFGLARAVSQATSTATQGLLIGTVSYLAPEQLTHGAATARGDVYAAGIMLYEMLVGAKPHDGDSPIQVAYKHVNDDVPPPSQAVPGIPAYVDGLVLRATARDPNQRPADARAFLQLVRRARSALGQGVDDAQLTQDLGMAQRQGQPSQPPRAEHTLVAPMEPMPAGAHRQGGRLGPFTPSGAPGVVGVRQPSYDDEDYEGRPPPPWWRRLWVIGAFVLALFVVAGSVCWLAAVGPFTRVPEVIGTSRAALPQLGERSGVVFVPRLVFHEQVPKDRVIRSIPTRGERMFRGGTVEVWVSRGPERHLVPNVIGMTERRARRVVTGANLAVAPIQQEYNSDVEAGRVIRTSPTPDTPLRRDAPVTLVVSRGPEPLSIPSVVGLEITQATTTLEGLGLTVARSDAFSDTVPPNAVISQDPQPGQGHRGDTVNLVVSKGPEFIPVPDVVRMGEEEATKALTDAGFEVEVRQSSLYLGMNVIASQNPPAGQPTRVGSTIILEKV